MTIPDVMFDSYSWTEINIFMFVKRNTGKDGTLQVSLQQIADEFGTTRGKVHYLLNKFYAQKLLFQTVSKQRSNSVQTAFKQKGDANKGETTDFQTVFKQCSNSVQTVFKQKDTGKCNIKLRANAFGQKLIPYMEEYGKNMIRKFFDYWTEANENGKKMRFEKEKTFDIQRRLERWWRQDTEKKRNATLNTSRSGLHQDGTILHESQMDVTQGGW